MSEQGNRKPVLLAVTGVAATLVLLLAYRRYAASTVSTPSSLHRSNAVRRSRRRWRRGYAPRELSQNPIETAIQNLRSRIEESRPYGRYDNKFLFTVEEEALEGGLFDLLPGNISQIHTLLSNVRPMTELEQDKLKFHISSLFIQNFLLEEFPSGWMIGDDVETLIQELGAYNIDEDCIRMMTHYFDNGKPMLPENWDVRDAAVPDGPGNSAQADNAVERASAQQAIEALAGPSQLEGSDDSDDDDAELESDPGGSQNMLDLLYHIASEQAKREGFIHRTRQCNSCGVKPIQGIRYHCANCYEYDLCEDCEAQQVHNRSHIFYKIRIPAPERSHLAQPLPVLYPGQPNAFPNTMPRELQKRLVNELGMDKTEMEASYEQFKCLAGEQIPIEDDPARLGMAISRHNFDMYFTPSSADRPPRPNLIYDRIFAFYDSNHDGLITLDEYIVGLITIMDKTRGARLKRMFMGFDLDADGFVDRRDFLRMFRAYYALSKELNEEMITLQNELDDDIRDVVQSSQPISAAFSGHYFHGHASRGGQDKELDPDGDLVTVAGPSGVLANDTGLSGDRARAMGNIAVRDRTQAHPFRSFRPRPDPDEPLTDFPGMYSDGSSIPLANDVHDDELTGSDPTLHVYGWPPEQTPESQDIVAALGVDIPLDEVTDPIDRSRIIYAQMQRLDEQSDRIIASGRNSAIQEFWRRRQFYLDEEEGFTRPPGYTEPDSSEDEAASIDEPVDPVPQTSSSSRRQSMRSRSSSKVRFDDSAIDTDHETRSNTSSRSIPLNERWGGYELSGPERDVGKEIIYQAVQQGFSELLDPLFKKAEDDAMDAIATKPERLKWTKEIDEYEAKVKKKAEEKAEALKRADELRTQALFSNGVEETAEVLPTQVQDRSSTPASNPDETDHIKIMFGDSPAKPVSTAEHIAEPPSQPSFQDKYKDPTLPQNKPNAPGFHDLDNSSSPRKPTDSMLKIWLRYRRIDQEAQKRGGYGKLSYREFCRLMIQEADRYSMKDAWAADSTRRRAREKRIRLLATSRLIDVGGGVEVFEDDSDFDDSKSHKDDEEDYDQMWSSTADLGRMSFCGAWLEMAQF